MKNRILLLILFTLFLMNIVLAQNAIEDDTPIKVDTLLLTVPLVVTDSKGRYVSGLTKDNFSIYENRKNQEIAFFFGEESPMNVAILLDTSISTKEVLGNIQKAARDFIKVFRAGDKGIIVSFDNRTAFLSELTNDKKQLSKVVNNVHIAANGGSDLNAAVFQIVDNYFASLKGRKAIIVLTDGQILKRNISTQQTLEKLLDADTVIYPIVFKTKSNSEALSKTNRPLPVEMLEFLADGTAGRFYIKDATNLKEAFQSIAEELKKQYLIGFYPQYAETGKSGRDFRIKIDRTDLTVETKKKWQF